MQILEHWDFGFVHQVLSLSRTDNESISAAFRSFQPEAVDRYIQVQRYSSLFLDTNEAAALRRESKRTYYRTLAHEALRVRERAFWRYHERGLKTVRETLDWGYLALQIGRELLWLAANPGTTTLSLIRHLRPRGKGGMR
jgi:hypothetical protein